MSEGGADSSGEPRFDLAERTAVFGEAVIEYLRKVRRDAITTPLIGQLVRSATSIGANDDEADEATTKKDFRYRIGVSKKEARETKRWLRMMAAASPDQRDDARKLWKEANELHLIFAAIYRKTKIDE
ncbi:MAG: four helix bundle protein [Planctomycetes bacterium]|nr:four helix bundle protein [Planctomycetota bacterium]